MSISNPVLGETHLVPLTLFEYTVTYVYNGEEWVACAPEDINQLIILLCNFGEIKINTIPRDGISPKFWVAFFPNEDIFKRVWFSSDSETLTQALYQLFQKALRLKIIR